MFRYFTAPGFTSLIAAALCYSTAASALTLPPEALQGHVQLCMDTAQLPGSNRSALTSAQLKAWCGCEVPAYWASVPQAEMEAQNREMAAGKLNGPANQRLTSQMPARQNAARLQCNKQLGLNVPPQK